MVILDMDAVSNYVLMTLPPQTVGKLRLVLANLQ